MQFSDHANQIDWGCLLLLLIVETIDDSGVIVFNANRHPILWRHHHHHRLHLLIAVSQTTTLAVIWSQPHTKNKKQDWGPRSIVYLANICSKIVLNHLIDRYKVHCICSQFPNPTTSLKTQRQGMMMMVGMRVAGRLMELRMNDLPVLAWYQIAGMELRMPYPSSSSSCCFTGLSAKLCNKIMIPHTTTTKGQWMMGFSILLK